jgi:predicted ArsR family transcriptional regulator
VKPPTQKTILAALEQHGCMTSARIACITGCTRAAVLAAINHLRADKQVHVEARIRTRGRDAFVYALGAGPGVPLQREHTDLPVLARRELLPVLRQAPASLTAQAVANRTDLELAWGGEL